jgi:2-polyprenyl-3-methyl-5-hydroxy-6-metoxy-1,4-benzoquinol methylase
MLQFTGPGRKITGIDYDEEKIALAAHCVSRSDSTRFVHADALTFEMEDYDCIILSDILHYLQPPGQTKLLENCKRHLAVNGTIIIRDGNKDLQKRHRGTRLSEFFSTRLLGFNKTAEAGLFFLDGNTITTFAKAHNLQYRVLDETKLTSNIVYVLSAASSKIS